MASKYSEQGADELVFLDITATLESRNNVVDLVEQVVIRKRYLFLSRLGVVLEK